jgi:hypothetical protein
MATVKSRFANWRATKKHHRYDLTLVSCYDHITAKRMPPEVLEYLRSMGKAFDKLGGKKAAKNMTADERSARAKKAAMAR